MLPNSPAYILSTTGALGAGVIVTTINPSYTPHEVARQIKMSKAKAILSNVALLPVVNEAIQLLGKLDVPTQRCKIYKKPFQYVILDSEHMWLILVKKI